MIIYNKITNDSCEIGGILTTKHAKDTKTESIAGHTCPNKLLKG